MKDYTVICTFAGRTLREDQLTIDQAVSCYRALRQAMPKARLEIYTLKAVTEDLKDLIGG